MEHKGKGLINLREVEGVVSPHQGQIESAIRLRKDALEYVDDTTELAEFVGGKVESLGIGEDWAVSKEIFPGVVIFFIYNRGDEEIPGNFRVLYSGDRMRLLKGEDLASITIPYINHILRYVREANPDKKLPEVCYRV